MAILGFLMFLSTTSSHVILSKDALVPKSPHAAVKLSTENMEIKKLLKIVAHFYYLKQF